MSYNIWYEQFMMNCFSDSMESASKKNHLQSFLIFMCMLWVPIVNLRSSLAIIFQQMDWRLKYLIWTLVNGIKQTIILFQLVIGEHLNLKLVNKQVNINLRISNYATTHTEESVYIIGGSNGPQTIASTIAQFKDDIWTNAGNLNQARHSHGAIIVGAELK